MHAIVLSVVVLECDDETQLKSAPIKVAMKGPLKLVHIVY
jgi:hypothetical protein